MILKENEKMKKPVLDKQIFDISIGVLLGDASIQRNTSKREEKHRLKFLQGEKHAPYLYHLYNCYTDLAISKPFLNKKRRCISFQTLFDVKFNCLADIFFKKDIQSVERGKKLDLSYFSKNALSPCSLAYWFMDDGGKLSYKKDWERKGLVFNTQGFSRAEVETLCKNVSENYSINCWVKENKEKPIIAISGLCSKKLVSAFFEHMHPTMLYKLPKNLLEELFEEKKGNL